MATALAVAACGSTAHPNGATGPATGHARTDLQSIFEDEALLHSGQPLATTFATFRSLGVQTLRVFLPWTYLAPDPNSAHVPAVDLRSQASYTASYFQFLDAVDRQARVSGIRLLFDVGAPAPHWALGPDRQTSLYYGAWKPNATAFGDLMYVLGQRYSGTYTPAGQSGPLPRVSDWSVWNEPNFVYLTPNAVGPKQIPYSPRLYRHLYDAAWSALSATGHTPTRDTILIGETAPRGKRGPGLPGKSGGLYPLDFIDSLYCVSASGHPLTGSAATAQGCPAAGSTSAFRAANPGLFDASGWADHPYSDTTAPNDAIGSEPGTADFATLGNLESALDTIFRTYGVDRRIPIYDTEYGYETTPPSPYGLPDAEAAAYLNQTEYLSWLNPRIRSYSQYLLLDPTDPAADPFDTGLETPHANGAPTPKPDVYDAYRMPLWLPRTRETSGGSLLVWGCLRPANGTPTVARTVQIQLAASGSSTFRTVASAQIDPADGGCYFERTVHFPAAGQVRLRYAGSLGTLISRTQTITVG